MTLIEEIKKIQNKAKSLMWGSDSCSDTKTVFAVGHKSYVGVVKYFTVDCFNESFNLNVLHSEGETLVKQCSSTEEIVAGVVELLKEWFPAKGVE